VGAAAAREASLRRLQALVRDVNRDLDLDRTLAAVCQGVVDGLGFEVAVVNLVMPDGALEVVSVVGDAGAAEALLGTRASRQEWDELLAACTPQGRVLVGYDHDRHPDTVASWVPETPVSDDPEAWHPLDELFAPLETASSGLLGVLSVDLPRDGRRPSAEQLELLEMYAAQAAVAVENAALHTAQSRALERLAAVVAEAPVAILELDLDGRVREWNPEAERLFGWRRDEVLGRPNPTVDVGDAEYAALLRQLRDSGGVQRQLVRRRRKDGSLVDVEMSNTVLRDAAGQVFGYLGTLADVSDRVALEADLRAAAYSDALTGMPNRARFRERLDAAAADVASAWLLLLDLDGFKSVNDSLGHGAGDRLLVDVAARLREACREDDLPARLGGDEFVVLVRGDREAAEALARRLVRRLSRPFRLAEREVVLGCSVGLAPVPPGDASAALRDADIAMYAAKAAGKGRYEVFESFLAEAALRRAELAEDLRSAVSRSQLELRYHPLVLTRSGGVVGVEALLRWHHPERGELAPADFIPVAEETGSIVALGEWVLHEACRQLKRWQQLPRTERLTVSVNVSPVQLRHPALVGQVRSALTTSGIAPDRLVLEITEDVLLDDLDAAVAVLERIRALGVRLALDDFGAGYSSLRYLRRLPVDVVKLDRALLADVDHDDDARSLLAAVLGLVYSLGRLAVVEGVETLPQLQAVQALGDVCVQGWLFAPPLPVAQAEQVLRAGWPCSAVPAPRSASVASAAVPSRC
jgi:diguanylate cyclase (GGDEF)-like protein/PAS domain S-box-containing protein